MIYKISTFFIFLCVISLSIIAQEQMPPLQNSAQASLPEYDKAFHLSISNPDSALLLLDYCLSHYRHIHDTTMIINTQVMAHDICKTHMRYKCAYDRAWDVLAFAKEKGDSIALYRIYDDIGNMYFIFHNLDEANVYYQQSLALNLQLVGNGSVDEFSLISSYFNLVMLNNRMGDYRIGERYLDTCFVIAQKLDVDSVKLGYLNAERANIARLNQKFELAEDLLLKTIRVFETLSQDKVNYVSDVGYLVMLYSFLGDVYLDMENFDSALSYYENSLDAMTKLDSHKSYEADLLLKIANIYHHKGLHDLAYRSLRRSKAINDRVYSTTSSQNLDLLKIRNTYEDDLQAKNELIYVQNIEAKERERKLLYVKTILIASIALFVVVLLIAILIYEKKKFIRKEKEDRRIIEMKNKELTSFSLQFVEKEKQVAELTEFIRVKMPKDKAGQKLVSKSKKNREQYWEEFNSRFVKVNKHFYKNLSKRYPSLTSTDLKHCALIKLNFSNKEIADLLSISVSSVYMSHHRLRKKLSLDNEVNLSNFITAF